MSLIFSCTTEPISVEKMRAAQAKTATKAEGGIRLLSLKQIVFQTDSNRKIVPSQCGNLTLCSVVS